VFFVTLFLFTTIYDHLTHGDWALLENFFFSFWVATFLFMTLLLRSKKGEAEKG